MDGQSSISDLPLAHLCNVNADDNLMLAFDVTTDVRLSCPSLTVTDADVKEAL